VLRVVKFSDLGLHERGAPCARTRVAAGDASGLRPRAPVDARLHTHAAPRLRLHRVDVCTARPDDETFRAVEDVHRQALRRCGTLRRGPARGRLTRIAVLHQRCGAVVVWIVLLLCRRSMLHVLWLCVEPVVVLLMILRSVVLVIEGLQLMRQSQLRLLLGLMVLIAVVLICIIHLLI